MEKCRLQTGNQTFCNLFDPLLVFAQSFALGAALCTLFGLPTPSHSADVKLALDNITDIQHSGASRARASTNNDHQHFAVGSAPPAPNDLAEVKLEVEHENITDSQHSTESESQIWASELIRLRDAANSQLHLQKLDNQQTFEIKSPAKISSHVPFAHSASTTPQNHSKDSGQGGTVCTPERDNAQGTRQTPFLQSGSERLGGSAKKNINRTADLAKKKRLTNHPEWRGSTSSSSTSSASTPHSDSELVVTFTDSSTFVRSCGPELSSMHCASKTADKNREQFGVLVDGSYHSAVNDILYNEPVDAGVNDVDSKDQVTAGHDDLHSAKSCSSAVSGTGSDPRKKECKRRCVPCAKCGQSFGRKSLRRHQALCSLSPQELATKFCCKICGRLSETQRGLSAHMSGFHKILKSKECNICGETFMKWIQVTRHKLATHQVKEHSCHVCGKSYTEKSSLNVHLEVHSGIKRHTCEFCGKQFLRYTTLCDHKVTVHNAGTEVLPCQHCDQTFSTQWHLHQHLGKKHSTGPYFERAKALSLKHSKSETGKQQQTPRWMIKRSNIRCDVCGKTFAFPSVLKKHYESHNERLYQCSMCPRRFRSHKSAARHEQVHNQESKLKCELCGKYLSHRSSFNKHMRLQHSRS